MSRDTREAPLPRLTAVPAARSRAAALRVRFYLVLGALLLTSSLGVFGAVSWLTYQPPEVDVTAANPEGQALAFITAQAFLAGENLPLPGAVGVELPAGAPVDFYGEIAWEGYIRFTLGGQPAERHSFLFYRPVVDGQGRTSYQLMRLTVLVSLPAGGNPVLAARPHFAPAPVQSFEVYTDYTDLEGPSLPAPARAQLEAWAGAWAADDSEQLKLLTGDTTAGVRYLGLGGYEADGIRAIATVPISADSYLVRARVALSSANGSTLEMDMDLTLTDASSGLPKVVGWGPAGSGVLSPERVRVAA